MHLSIHLSIYLAIYLSLPESASHHSGVHLFDSIVSKSDLKPWVFSIINHLLTGMILQVADKNLRNSTEMYPPEVSQLAPEKLPSQKRKVIFQPSFFRG